MTPKARCKRRCEESIYSNSQRQKERQMRMRTFLTLVTAFAAVVIASTALPAVAKVPGQNGRVLYGVVDPNLGDTVIYTANPDGSHAQQLLPGPPQASECPNWSPDGTQIAVCGDQSGGSGSASIINPDDGSYRVVPNPDPTDLFLPCSLWTPDGQRLTCEGFGQTDQSLNGIYTIRSSDGGGLTRLTSNPNGDDVPGDYSPDGTQLVFLRHDPTRPACPPRLFNCPTANTALLILNLASGALRQITPWGLANSPGSWSPDGTKILFTGGGSRFSEAGSLYVVHPDGSALAKITLTGTNNNSGVQGASWSPDGTKIILAFKNLSTGDEEIYTANADGSDLQPVTTNAHDVFWVDWGTHPLSP
jgi:Tol biopolymer transport system component